MPSNKITGLLAREITCARENKNLFHPINFELYPQELIFIEGPNGSGKSSLLRILTGLATPSSGTIYWQDQPIQQLTETFKEELHYIGHTNGIKQGLTVLENLTLMQQLQSNPVFIDAQEILSLLKLTSYQHCLTKNLSAGQKRKVALAKLFLIKKPLWILDEPLTALDETTQKNFFRQLKEHLFNDGLCIMSTHQTYDVHQAKNLRLLSC